MSEEDARAKADREGELQPQSKNYVIQQEVIGAEACKQRLGKLPLQCDAETLQKQGDEVTDRGAEHMCRRPAGEARPHLVKASVWRGRAAKEG